MASPGTETLEDKKQEEGASDADVEEGNQTPEEDDDQEVEEKYSTPFLSRSVRERKTVERYSQTGARASATKPLTIPKGQGTQLKDIPNVAFKMSKRKPDDNLQLLHSILFGKKAKANMLKKNLGLFSGFVWAEDEQEKQRKKVKEKLDKCVKDKLWSFCDILNIPINKASTKKEELSTRLLEFLESPHPTTDTLLADKEKKGKGQKRKTSASKSKTSSDKSAEKSAKKSKQNSQVGEKRKRSSKVEVENEEDEPSVSDDGSQEDDTSDVKAKAHSDDDKNVPEADSEEDKEPPRKQKSAKKSPVKKVPRNDSRAKSQIKSKAAEKGSGGKSPKSLSKTGNVSSGSESEESFSDADKTTKSSASSAKKERTTKSRAPPAKKQKVEKEYEGSQSASDKKKVSSRDEPNKSPGNAKEKDQGKGKSVKEDKPEPTREEMHAVVTTMLKEVDFDKATLSDILRQLGEHFDVDLMHRKVEVKAIITDVINNMTDEEGDEEEESEAGEDPEKDDDVDNDDA